MIDDSWSGEKENNKQNAGRTLYGMSIMVKPQQKTEVAVDVVVKMIGLITFYGSQAAAAGVPFV